MLPLEIILFSIADIYYKALYSIIIFWICQKICSLLCYMLFLILPCRLRKPKIFTICALQNNFCWPLCILSLKLWKVKDERWEVCEESRNSLSLGWWQCRGRAGSKEGSMRETWYPGPGLYWGCWTLPGARVMAPAHIYLQAVLKIECLYVVQIRHSQFYRASFLVLFSGVMKYFSVHNAIK